MTIRSIAAVCCAVVMCAVVLAPVDASARARGAAVRSAPAPRVSLPPARPRPGIAGPRSNIHAGKTGVVRAASNSGAPRTKHLADSRIKSAHGHKHDNVGHDRRFRRHVGRHLPVAGIGIWYGPLYDTGFYNPGFYAPAQQGPIIGPANDLPPYRERVAVRGCRSHTVVVPSEAGGERKVNVTECNLP